MLLTGFSELDSQVERISFLLRVLYLTRDRYIITGVRVLHLEDYPSLGWFGTGMWHNPI